VGTLTPAVRVVVIVLAALAIIGLIAYARGHIHHHGWYQIGSHGVAAAAWAPEPYRG
jgi:hypothetical protein